MRLTEEQKEILENEAGVTPVPTLAKKLGVTYYALAGYMREHSLGTGKQKPRRKRPTGEYTKPNVKRHIQEYDYRPNGMTIAQYARANGLKLEQFVHAIKVHFPDWWYAFTQTDPEQISFCNECGDDYVKGRSDQMYCSSVCATRARADEDYFGGERENTIGLKDQICQICGRHVAKGISSHHVFGKGNDEENQYLVALCSGCHDTLTYLAGRPWVADPATWENLIVMSLYRSVNDAYKNWGDETGFEVDVSIRFKS